MARSRFPLLALLLAGLVACRTRTPEPPPPPQPVQVTLVAVGDLLMHQDVKRAARENGGFQALWGDLKPLFDEADLVFGNLETPIAPASGGPGRPFIFNAPEELPGALKASGFTVLSTANNHAYDQGAQGVVETLERLETARLVGIGSGRDQTQAERLCILERKGIKIAFLAFTDLFNSNLNREGKGPWVRPLNVSSPNAVKAVRMLADLVVVSVHWGVEYEHQPRPRQREMAARLIGAGADLVIGHHPHVLQPLEWLEADGRKGAVAFSLGNFISNQDRIYNPLTMPLTAGDNRDGAALVATFRKEGSRSCLEAVRIEPLWTENNWTDFVSQKVQRREIRVVRAGKNGGLLEARRDRIGQVMSPTALQP